MILDKIKNAPLYSTLGERLAKGLELIADPAMADKEEGRYEVDGENLFYMIQKYTTKDKEEMLFEAHREYIDIQVVLEGREIIGWAPTDSLEITEPYKPDILKGSDPDNYTELKLEKGTFALLYPGDAHKPCCQMGGKTAVTKMVVKVKC